MKIERDASLQPYNTFGFHATARQFFILDHPDRIKDIFSRFHDPLIIGGGSNILLSRPVYPEVIVTRLTGIQITEEDEDRVLVRVGAGEDWHRFVLWSLDQNLGGVENLSLIPGTAGAAPIQNIGAYGIELRDVLHGLDYFMFEDMKSRFVPAADCQFGYRDSIFKNAWKGKGLITHIYIWLRKPPHPVHTHYKALSDHLRDQGIGNPTIRQVSDAVIAVRRSKLPDWRELGNAGSFFKNPVIPDALFQKLKDTYRTVPHYPAGPGHTKIPAAWLIQEAGFKGQRRGQAGSYQFQPLVLVNFGADHPADLLRLKKEIQEEVSARFGIDLQPEVTIL